MSEEALGRHEDQRLAVAAVDLAPQRVKVLGGRGQVADLHVVLRAELQKAFETRARVLGTLPLKAVR